MADPAFIKQLRMDQTTIYLTAAAGALVAYDQVLTFSQEVNLVWNRQWGFTTALYLIARCLGSLFVIGNAAFYMCINWTYSVNVNMFLAVNWASNIFLLAMQAMLVIRVHALFNRSKKVLVFLTTLYVLQATATFVLAGLILNKRVFEEYFIFVGPAIGSVTEAFNENSPAFPTTMDQDGIIFSIVFDTILLFFALWAFVKHALEARTLNGGWSINVLVRTNLIWLSIDLVAAYTTELNAFYLLICRMFSVFSALVVIAGPRMVISLRTTETKTRGEGGTLEGEVSTIRFGVREPPTQSESAMEDGGVFRATDENAQID
ncbi:hypothetical protein BJ138DRAFT_459507 [Hygrophoropsis aurantiaca]|uniref:Uncharacterized protein n=1 Tax=Hygrophoropsis aurantiaca TaxID=72124 RepID=A0ACB8A372_9AGAM|nr:hypothetical protein BJ138DRAFT_459507 [Hygrophoropsis aurantiaca]